MLGLVKAHRRLTVGCSVALGVVVASATFLLTRPDVPFGSSGGANGRIGAVVIDKWYGISFAGREASGVAAVRHVTLTTTGKGCEATARLLPPRTTPSVGFRFDQPLGREARDFVFTKNSEQLSIYLRTTTGDRCALTRMSVGLRHWGIPVSASTSEDISLDATHR
jgi:hypothetical protein